MLLNLENLDEEIAAFEASDHEALKKELEIHREKVDRVLTDLQNWAEKNPVAFLILTDHEELVARSCTPFSDYDDEAEIVEKIELQVY